MLPTNNEPFHSKSASFADKKMIEAFGTPLLNSDGKWINDMWEIIWKRTVKLRGKLYALSGGSVGRLFVSTLAAAVLELGKGKQKSEVSICFPTLILQRNKEIVKTADIRRLISRRLKLWNEKRFFDLISEAEMCDKKLSSKQVKMTEEKAVAIFTRLLLSGKIREATRFITERQESGGVMLPHEDAIKPAGKTVLEVLQMKHPNQAEPHADAFIDCDVLPVLVDVTVTGAHVRKTAHKLSGSAGPSGADSTHWQSWLLKYGNHSNELCNAIAVLIERQANTVVDWEEIRAQKAKRELALKKLPAGVRPIGIGELMDRLSDKVMIDITNNDVKEACNADQLCSGIKAGIESAVHSIRELFNQNSDAGFGLLLMDAANAFGSISRSAALWNARVLWSRCSRFLFNSYRGYALLIIKGSSSTLLSKEGVTQGVPSAMKLYAIGLLPLTLKLKDSSDFVKGQWDIFKSNEEFLQTNEEEMVPKWTQSWYADDSSCINYLKFVLFWMKLLMQEGPKYGYYPEPDKSYLVVAPAFIEEAKQLFSPYGVVVVEGHRVLGGFVGSKLAGDEWAANKIQTWDKSLKILAHVATTQPQAAYVAVSKSLQNEWGYLQRVFPDCQELFSPLRKTLMEDFIPSLVGNPISEIEFKIMEKPTRLAGLGIRDPVSSSKQYFETSTKATELLSKAIISNSSIDIDEYEKSMHAITSGMKKNKESDDLIQVKQLAGMLSDGRSHKISRILENKCSTWLSVFPTNDNYFAMSPDEFRDAMAIRYHFGFKEIQNICDGCGDDFDLNHALNCKKGGLVTARHNEARDLNCDLCSLAGLPQIVSEPIISESKDDNDKGLRADWSVRGFWEHQRVALFDICILNADATSYQNKPLKSIFQARKQTKKEKYSAAAEARRASFTPIIASCEAIFDCEAEVYFKRLATILSKKWDSSYSHALSYIRARMQICIMRSVSLCIRGCRTKWRGAGIVDYAAIPLNVFNSDE
jgi:hypothetical protein